jgi:A/G-specific adenine glycosylase
MRVLTRVLAMHEDIALPPTRAKLQEIANDFLDKRDPSTHNQAVMELGATVCLPRKPMCLICPLRDDCRGRDRAEEFPVKTRVVQVKRSEIVAILPWGKSFYCEQVPEGKPWHGLWRFPDFDPTRMVQGEKIAKIKYGITKYSVTMDAVSAKWKSRVPSTGRYLTPEQIHSLAFAAPHRKLAAMIINSAPSGKH